MKDNILSYDTIPSISAFTAGRDSVLPCTVTQGHQVHDCKIAYISHPGMTREELEGYDGFITDIPGIAVGVRTADCIPVLLYDEKGRGVAAVHAGWKGTVKRIVQKAIFHMIDRFKVEAEDLHAIIGPGISFDSFQVGEEVVGFFKDSGFPVERIYRWDGPRAENMKGGHHIDLKEANRWLLQEIGVLDENITVCDIDTYKEEAFYSARREGIECGRNINAIMLIDSSN